MKIVLLQFGSGVPGGTQSLDEPKYKVLVLGRFGNCVSHRETTHLACSRGGGSAFLIASTMLGVCVDRIGRTSAVK
jgi:hypothetical protein